MNFQNLPKIEDSQKYLEVAIKSAKKRVERLEKPRLKDQEKKRRYMQYAEIERIKEAAASLCAQLRAVHEKFPSLDSLPPFYNALAKVTIRYNETKHALGAIKWAEQQCKEIGKKYTEEIKRTRTKEDLQKKKRDFYGRISSILRQIKNKFVIVDESRRVMKTWPDIKLEIRTIAISGYPNVGKSSILKALTGTHPEIKAYAFTTKSLNVGYMEVEPRTYQIIDTPGAFDRDLSKMNNVEKQAWTVLQHLAEKIVYVFDPSESCGYEVEKQIQLFKKIEKQFGKPIIVVCNKMDLESSNAKKIKNAEETFTLIEVSVPRNQGIEELKKRIAEKWTR